MRSGTPDNLLRRNRELQRRLDEAEETLRALRSGEVDAVVASGPEGDRVYTLKGADEAYRVIVQDMAEGAVTLTLDGMILFSNEQFATMVRAPLERVIGSDIRDFVVPGDAPVVGALLARGDHKKSEVRLKVGAGAVPAYLSVNTLLLDGLECVCMIVTDLTEHKRNQNIVAAEKLARSILDQAAGAILVVDPGGTIIRASSAAEQLAGASVLLRRFNDVFSLRAGADSRDYLFEDILSQVQRAGAIEGLDATARIPGERTLHLILNAALLTGPESELLGCTIVLQDISRLKRAEEALLSSETRYRSLFDNSHDALFHTTGEGQIVAANPAACALFGMSEQEIRQLGRNGLAGFADPGFREWFDGRHGTAGAGGEVAFACQNGGRFIGEVSSVPVEENGSAFVIVRDVTERKEAERQIHDLNADLEKRVVERTAQLQASNKELEAFAYSVSHDLRAPLRGIDGWSLALLEDYGAQLDAQGQQHLRTIRSETQRLGTLIDDLLQLSRITRAEMKRDAVNLSKLAQAIADRLRDGAAGRRIEFIIRPGLTTGGDAPLLEVALTNLFDNAVKFTGPRAEARIEFGQCEAERERAFFVRDNGVGFDMAYSGALFNAFNRLHKPSEFPGAGIGLATVQRVIRRHGGRVWAEAKPDHGATFYFTLAGTA